VLVDVVEINIMLNFKLLFFFVIGFRLLLAPRLLMSMAVKIRIRGEFFECVFIVVFCCIFVW